MIDASDLKAVGKFLKPHGINGEITLFRDFDDLDFSEFSCVIVDVDGIFVPFFINSVRPKGADTDLVGIDGIADETQAARLTNKTVYLLRRELAEMRLRNADEDEETSDDEEGLFAEDLVGYEVVTDAGEKLGKIADIDDTTSNYLFVVETPEGENLLIPVAEEFIVGVDSAEKLLTLNLPEGLLSL